MANLENKLKKLLKENRALKQENLKLKEALVLRNATDEINAHSNPNPLQSREEKINHRIQLFRSLFCGREDVFAVRWTSKEGKSGYSPVREQSNDNESKYKSFTDQVIYDHLSGKKTIGVYPLFKDDTCRFLAIDFDKQNWKKDVSVLLDVCEEMNVPASLERSRSGNGGHIWIFFSENVSAFLARRLGFSLLER